MQHLQPVPPDFAQRLRAAHGSVERLAALAQHRLGYLESIQLANALPPAAGADAAGFTRVRLALLGDSTLDHLAPAIRVAGLRRRMLIEIHRGAFGQYRQEMLDPPAPLRAFRPDTVLLSLTAREALAGVAIGATPDEADDAVAAAVADLRALWASARDHLGAGVLQQTFLDVSAPVFGCFDCLVPGAPARLVSGLNAQVAAAAALEGVLVLDVARASARDGLAAWFDVGRWLQAKMQIAPQAAVPYGEMVARILGAQRGLSRKCLVLDLDNTLWGGVVGDDGVEGIVLGPGSALGEAHLALQRHARLLAERGVILAVCSKNDPVVAAAAFDSHPEMLLRRADIAAFVANWNDKAANLEAIAAQLNIGLDSLVFVDDNPAERARVRESLPMVAVPELPDDPALYVQCLAGAGYFEAVAFTVDDRQRASQYAGNAQREVLRGTLQSVDDYLRALDMSLDHGPVAAVDQARVAQLINRTNQFNPTTCRCTVDELAALAAAPENIALRFRLVDRFGDNGLISALVLRPAADDAEALEVFAWVMSCRVFGREVEHEAMNIAVEAARRRGCRSLRARYLPSAKNGVVAGLYAQLGFVRVADARAAEGQTDWALDLDAYTPRATHITRRSPP